jgi:hypothetical protein
MLQRIQTIYLLLVSFLTALLLFFPLAVIGANDDFYSFSVTGIKHFINDEVSVPAWGLLFMTISISLIALITVFLFKRRMLQIRFTIFNFILKLGLYGVIAYLLWDMKSGVENFVFDPKIAMCLPAVCLILDYLAIRNIGADEALVRSLDRLR